MRPMKPICVSCGDTFAPARRLAGYHLCMPCGEQRSVQERRGWCVLTPHKQGAMFFTTDFAPEAAKGINNKGGLIK